MGSFPMAMTFWKEGEPLNAEWLLRRDMKVTESSESVLAGTKRPPFRLVCRALSASGVRLPIRPVVSEEFVVRVPSLTNWHTVQTPHVRSFFVFDFRARCRPACAFPPARLFPRYLWYVLCPDHRTQACILQARASAIHPSQVPQNIVAGSLVFHTHGDLEGCRTSMTEANLCPAPHIAQEHF